MKIGVLQACNNGFFPHFYRNIFDALTRQGDTAVLFSPRNGSNYRTRLPGQIFWGSRLNWHVHSMLYKLTGVKDIYSTLDTLDLIYKIKQVKPDLIHLNVIGDCILNLPLFMRYISKHNIPVVWTMHDCRAFTGGCPYFDEVECYKWKFGCGNCNDTQYRTSLCDKTARQWRIMKTALTDIPRMTIVTPSMWLQKFVKQSYLKNYKCSVIYNGIDQGIFNSANGDIIRKNLGLTHKKIVLGVAASWTARKGLDSFKYLAYNLPDDYQVVLVGNLPENIPRIVNLPATSDIKEIANYYAMADVFCNPTLADNFPTTNIEALSVGTPVVTYRTGGSPEAVDTTSGLVVEKGNYTKLIKAVTEICTNKDCFSTESCKQRSKCFSTSQYDKYVSLFKNIVYDT